MTTRLLVIGYGNEGRGDDGIGPRVARAVARWKRPGLLALDVHGLTPELAERMSQAERVVFVDARAGDEEEGVQVVALKAAERTTCLGHSSDPRGLLGLVEFLWDHHPRAWLLTVPGVKFEIGQVLSPRAKRGIEKALRTIREIADLP